MSTFDYTSRDFSSIQEDLLRRAQTQIPEWTTREPSDFGMVLVDLWAYMGDILHYYVDRAAGESFLETATQRESVLAIANLLDYVPAGRRPATASIVIDASATAATDTSPIYIPKYTRFLATPLVTSATSVVFTSDTPIAFVGTSSGASVNRVYNGVTYTTYPKTQTVTLGVTEGEIFTETYTSTGLSGQQVTLRNTGAVTESITITADENALNDVPYTYVSRLILADSSTRAFSVDITADNYSVVTFGNGVNGRIPPVNTTITITYRRSRGAAGNVAVGAINRIESYTASGFPSLDGLKITANATAATGGVDIESITSLKANIPAAFRSQDRAVSLQDYIDIVKRIPGIVKSTAWVNGSTVEIRAAVTPSNYGDSLALVLSSDKVTEITNYLAPRQIAYVASNVGASITVDRVNLVMSVRVKDGYIQEIVRDNVSAAVADLFSFDNVDIDSTVALGEVYRTAMAVEGVDYVNVTNFSTSGTSGTIDTSGSFIGVTPTSHAMLAKRTASPASVWTVTASGGITALGS